MGNLTMDIATLSKLGGREENQDTLGWQHTQDYSLFVLADGLGGQACGGLAAKIAVDSLLALKPVTPEQLALAFEEAHQAIRHRQQENSQQARMASTLVALSISTQHAVWGHVGDSRIYWIREGAILHQSKDHSIPQLLVSDGEISAADIRHHPDRNRLHRVLGDSHLQIKARLSPQPQRIETGDVFLLCSDGFWEWVTEQQMMTALTNSSSSQQWLDNMETHLLAQLTDKFDNYSAIAIFC
jgi:PPM family protein phosphatase